jgi:hypothetical protein
MHSLSTGLSTGRWERGPGFHRAWPAISGLIHTVHRPARGIMATIFCIAQKPENHAQLRRSPDRLPGQKRPGGRHRQLPAPAQRQHPARRPAPGRRRRFVPDAGGMVPGRLRAGPAQVRRGLRPHRGGAPHGLDPVPVQRQAAPGHLRVQVRPLPGRPALPPPCRRAVLRHPPHRQQPPGHPLAGGGLQDPVPAHPRDQGQQGRGGGPAARHPGGPPRGLHRPGPLHAGAVPGVHQPTTPTASSTSTTPSCPPSTAPSPTSAPSSAA